MDLIIDQIKSEISHLTDGPLTMFVVIYRAAELAKTGEYSPYDIANALYEVIKDENLS